MHKTTWKRLALALVMLYVYLFKRLPRQTGYDRGGATHRSIEVLPFETATPSPSPVPGATGGSGWQSWGSTGTVTVTATPTAAPTVQIITASPRRPRYGPCRRWWSPPRPTDDGTLRNGDTGDKVRALQQQLKNLGYYTGSVDGDFGSGTEEALREFQRVNGLSVDGVAGRQTLSLLESGNARSKPTEAPTYFYATSRPTPRSYTPSTPSTYRYLQLGTNHEDVKRLEARLKELGYFTGTPNNVFDAETEAAVLAFQERNGLWVDGVAGEDTQRMLYSSSAPAAGPDRGQQLITEQHGIPNAQTRDRRGRCGAAPAAPFRPVLLYRRNRRQVRVHDGAGRAGVSAAQRADGGRRGRQRHAGCCL